MEDIIIEEIRRLLSGSGYLNGNQSIDKDESLFQSGMIDFSAFMLISKFIVEKYNCRVPPEDLVPEHFDTLSRMANYFSRMIPNPDEHQEWFEGNAEMFQDAIAIELPFVGLDRIAQTRLNEFKLYAMTHDHLVNWKGLDVLEFGAGHGRFAVELQGYRSYLGVDYSPSLVAIGRRRLASLNLQERANLVVDDCMEYKGEENSHDLVCCLGMLPYIEDYSSLIAKMAFHTKPGGMILVDFRHATPLYTLLRQIKWRLCSQTGGGSRAHSKRELARALNGAGLIDIRFMMREYPFLDTWYAEKSWDWALSARQLLSHRSWLDWLGMIGFAAARKPV